MSAHLTPGVHIKHVVIQPKHVLQTGVPVFLGLVSRQLLDELNQEQADLHEKFITQPIARAPATHLVRKRGYLRLPRRPPPSVEASLGDPGSGDTASYMQSVDTMRADERVQEQVIASGGAAGQLNSAQAAPTDETAPLNQTPQRFTLWPQFEATYGNLSDLGFLTRAVQGFFANGGSLCYVQVVAYEEGAMVEAVDAALEILADYDDYDLICAPDLMWPMLSGEAHGSRTGGDQITDEIAEEIVAMQRSIILHCELLGNRFAILDSLPQANVTDVEAQRHQLNGASAALYYPWVRVAHGPVTTGGLVPPCGHVAGVIARTDQRVGVHKAPANEEMEGVLDLAVRLTDEQQGPLNDIHVNCLRVFPRRGIRIWGARTLSPQPAWMYVNERRIFTTAARWLERNMIDVVFEPHTPALWARIVRNLTDYFTTLLEQGALAGGGSQPFYIKCDAETNPPEQRETGHIVTEIGLATTAPAEFIIVQLIHGPTGVRIVGPL